MVYYLLNKIIDNLLESACLARRPIGLDLMAGAKTLGSMVKAKILPNITGSLVRANTRGQ